MRSLARSHTTLAITTLAAIARGGDKDAARVAASSELLDRGWGRAAQAITGADGEGDIKITIRHILGEKKK